MRWYANYEVSQHYFNFQEINDLRKIRLPKEENHEKINNFICQVSCYTLILIWYALSNGKLKKFQMFSGPITDSDANFIKQKKVGFLSTVFATTQSCTDSEWHTRFLRTPAVLFFLLNPLWRQRTTQFLYLTSSQVDTNHHNLVALFVAPCQKTVEKKGKPIKSWMPTNWHFHIPAWRMGVNALTNTISRFGKVINS